MPKLIKIDRGLTKLLEKLFGAVFLPHMVNTLKTGYVLNVYKRYVTERHLMPTK